ncbi:2-succinyl-5-enolpyruvyl-6-hydroxy-3-cyclohexene-1-carboxylic-acid synthase [Veillonella criceti]|uniref:2-succinyl-5-enolpyruvyl-6-hydroxy-3-cyclohexene-1-carboxylate synthase n=1 Tax=Veillonella criceti TaxID=103891 RepID=A0A380NKP1_9FIRM|nr:2-succinyl-5-enolpyruvyl-6-hydroxy-3-cyclohexene-1-carboxylic-acid synthase [Veillonella criceti]SUP43427.1 2-succinyl-5-enolpyruvyl-6-hydroxy-3-cyclohexene-1-carboxylate synthase [Veillonella criceti]
MNEYIAAAVDELYQLGARQVVFSGGSRSTTMAMLFMAHGQYKTYMNIDERSAAFFALGIAKRSQTPVVLVCTSGSAGAHYYPALIEAYYSRVPLIVLTADRPPEAQFIGAPQTMDQVKLFGSYVRYFETLSPQADDFIYPRQVMNRAYMAATDVVPGPVHINVPLREPLVPELSATHFEKGRQKVPFKKVLGQGQLTIEVCESLAKDLMGKRGIMVCGPLTGYESWSVNYRDSLLKLAQQLHMPIVADPLSPMRAIDDEIVIDSYDAFLSDSEWQAELTPEYILLVGQIPVSKRLQQFVKAQHEAICYQIDPGAMYRNGALTTNVVLQVDPMAWATQMVSVLDTVRQDMNPSTAPTYLKRWQRAQALMRKQLNKVATEPTLFEGRFVHSLQQCVTAGTNVVVSNSMPIRDFDYFWQRGTSSISVYGNRGINGIDGIESTALGIGAAYGEPTILVTGDLSFFHDMNGLVMGKTEGLNLVIVLFNNDGGGIFEYLPQKGVTHFEYLFGTPQGLTYSALADLMGIHYQVVTAYESFPSLLQEAQQEGGIHILEVKTNREVSRELHRKYTVSVYEA